MGHLSVPFNNTDSRERRSAPEMQRLMAERIVEFEEDVREGGFGGWFPEGRLNFGDAHHLQQFKKGGFAPALDIDAELWCIAMCGNSVSWPAKGLPGKPAKVGVAVECLCTSTKDFLASSATPISDEEKRTQLADTAQGIIQRAIDKFAAE